MIAFSTLSSRTPPTEPTGERRSQYRIEQRYYERYGTNDPGILYNALKRLCGW